MFGLENTRFGKRVYEYLKKEEELREEVAEAEASFWQTTMGQFEFLGRKAQSLADSAARVEALLKSISMSLERCAKALEKMLIPLFEEPKPSKAEASRTEWPEEKPWDAPPDGYVPIRPRGSAVARSYMERKMTDASGVHWFATEKRKDCHTGEECWLWRRERRSLFLSASDKMRSDK